MKYSLFDSLFSRKSRLSSHIFFVFEKVPFMALYNGTIGVWGDSQMMWDLFQTRIKCKKLSLHSF